MKRLFCILMMGWLTCQLFANPITGMLERIDKGASKKIAIEIKKSGNNDYFELDQKGDQVLVRANNYVNVATGINWYLKYYVGVQLSWNGMTAKLPAKLPRVINKERHETSLKLRYDFNYCTYSYSMAFWIGNVGNRKLTGWHCTASICRLL